MRYNFHVVCVPRKCLVTADALSQKPLAKDKRLTGEHSVGEVSSFSKSCIQGLKTGSNLFQRVKDAQGADLVCKALHHLCRSDRPVEPKLPSHLMPYWQDRAMIAEYEGLLLHGTRLIIPQCL